MPCYQSTSLPSGVTAAGRTGYATEADCLNACKEGACCTGTTCSVKPQCQCQGTGQTFKGVGTTCTPNPCECRTAAGYGRCCGPGTFVFQGDGKTYVPCFGPITQAQCQARGGTWTEFLCCDKIEGSFDASFGSPDICNPLP